MISLIVLDLFFSTFVNRSVIYLIALRVLSKFLNSIFLKDINEYLIAVRRFACLIVNGKSKREGVVVLRN